MSRGMVGSTPQAVIRDPAAAVAAAKCWMARWHKGAGAKLIGVPKTTFHPEECGWCEYPPERLVAAVQEFGEWAGLKDSEVLGEPNYLNQEIEMFLALPAEEQKRLVMKQQGYLPEDEDGDDEGL